MEDIITVLVPLIATYPGVANALRIFRDGQWDWGKSAEIVRPYEHREFEAFFHLSTINDTQLIKRPDVLRLSQAVEMGMFFRTSLLIQNRDFIRKDETLAVAGRSTETELQDRLEKLMREMDDWIYDENSIIVACGPYVWTVITIASFLVEVDW
jgi:hypothetical protein